MADHQYNNDTLIPPTLRVSAGFRVTSITAGQVEVVPIDHHGREYAPMLLLEGQSITLDIPIALIMGDSPLKIANSDDDDEDACPDDCRFCSGEACNKCGAGCWNMSVTDCDHDVADRHEDPELLPPIR